MRKNFSKFILSLLTLFMLVITGINVNGRNKVVKAAYSDTAAYKLSITKNTSNTAYAKNCDITCNSVTWSIPGNQSLGNYVKLGGKDSSLSRYIYSKTAISSTNLLGKVDVDFGTKDTQITVNSIVMSCFTTADNASSNKNAISTTTISYKESSTVSTEFDAKNNTSLFFRFDFNMTSTKPSDNKGLILNYISFYEKVNIEQLSTPRDAIFDSNTIMVTPDTNASSYEVGLFDTTDNLVKSFPITLAEAEEGYTIDFAPQGEYTIKVKAIGDNKNYVSSEWSESIGTYTQNTINTKTVSEIASLASETKAPYTYYQVTGVVSEITAPSTGKFKLKDLETTDVIQVNGLKSKKENKTNSFDNLDIMVNDIITIIGYKTNNGMEGSYLSNLVDNPIERKYGETFALDQTKSQLMFSYTSVKDKSAESSTVKTSFSKYTFDTSEKNKEYDITSATGLNTELFNVTYNTNGNSSAYMNTNSGSVQIRLYPSNSNGTSLNIRCLKNNIKITSISITAFTTDDATMTVKDDSNKEITSSSASSPYSYEMTSGTTSFVIQNTTNATSGNQVKITGISITYSVEDVTYSITSASLRFGTTITKDLYDRILSKDSNATFGVISQATSTLNGAELTVDNKGDIEEIVPVRVANENATTADDTGSYYQFSVLYTGIEAENYDTEITARCYVCIDGTYYYMEAATYSVKTLADYYLTNCNTNEAVIAHSGALNYLQNYTASAE